MTVGATFQATQKYIQKERKREREKERKREREKERKREREKERKREREKQRDRETEKKLFHNVRFLDQSIKVVERANLNNVQLSKYTIQRQIY